MAIFSLASMKWRHYSVSACLASGLQRHGRQIYPHAVITYQALKNSISFYYQSPKLLIKHHLKTLKRHHLMYVKYLRLSSHKTHTPMKVFPTHICTCDRVSKHTPVTSIGSKLSKSHSKTRMKNLE